MHYVSYGWSLLEYRNYKILPIFHIISFNPNFFIADCTVSAKTSTRTKRSFFRSMILGPFVVWHLSISPYSGPTESPNQAHNWVTILKLRVKSQTVITKGQLILKGLFGILKFFQKPKNQRNIRHSTVWQKKTNSLVCFREESSA